MEKELFEDLYDYVYNEGLEKIIINSTKSSKIEDPHFQALVRIYIQAGDILKNYIKEKANEHN